jgi:hypothetical protein
MRKPSAKNEATGLAAGSFNIKTQRSSDLLLTRWVARGADRAERATNAVVAEAKRSK